jgi:hypothetical protein
VDALVGGGGLEGGEVAAVEDQLRNELLEVLVQTLLALPDVLQVGQDAVAHRSFKLYQSQNGQQAAKLLKNSIIQYAETSFAR